MILFIVVILLVTALLVYLDIKYRYYNRFNGNVFLEALKGNLYLTFDDGPASELVGMCNSLEDARKVSDSILKVDPNWDFNALPTENLVRILKKYGAKAIFFLRGDILENDIASHDLVRQMHQDGHIIGNHLFSHTHYTKQSPEQSLDEIARTDQIIEAIIGKKPTLFRPPYGAWHFFRTLRMWRKQNLSHYQLPCRWSHGTHDWENRERLDVKEIAKDVDIFINDLLEYKSGIIVLQHDVWIYCVLFTNLLLERLKQESLLKVGNPEDLSQHLEKMNKFARFGMGLPFYLYKRLRRI